MDIRELKAQMVRKGKTADQLCSVLGISKSAWYRKTGGDTQFTQSEIVGLRRELDLDDHLTARIFFNEEVS